MIAKERVIGSSRLEKEMVSLNGRLQFLSPNFFSLEVFFICYRVRPHDMYVAEGNESKGLPRRAIFQDQLLK